MRREAGRHAGWVASPSQVHRLILRWNLESLIILMCNVFWEESDQCRHMESKIRPWARIQTFFITTVLFPRGDRAHVQMSSEPWAAMPGTRRRSWVSVIVKGTWWFISQEEVFCTCWTWQNKVNLWYPGLLWINCKLIYWGKLKRVLERSQHTVINLTVTSNLINMNMTSVFCALFIHSSLYLHKVNSKWKEKKERFHFNMGKFLLSFSVRYTSQQFGLSSAWCSSPLLIICIQ